jgi:hypothetical protein
LAVTVSEWGKEIGGFIFDDFDHGLQVGAECGCALLQALLSGGAWVFGQ